ncbi:ABC transporter permease [Clostridium estertheticum]|uniref:ABC transporter permease n=1 Tax=Clostridium estertheticum TaxID=238834 RepID=UPI001C7D40DF|nr:FtsX-like permease family protein [Clostridium estertheticum]MBX4267521.1 FtsX-like permease family protein [Clostridium estertheticum]WLC91334.1 FtsX-like permease family protein [Clostridium estertheticum]
MKKKDELKLGYLNFKRNIIKSINPMIIVIIAILMLNLTTSFLLGLENGLSKSVVNNDTLKFISVLGKNNSQLGSNDISVINKIAGVKSVFPRITSFVGLRTDSKKESSTLLGVTNESLPYFSKNLKPFNKDNEIILNKNSTFALRDKLKLAYTVMTSENGGLQKETDVTVMNKYTQTSILDLPDNVSLTTVDLLMDLKAKFYNMSLKEYKDKYKPESLIVVANDISSVVSIANTIEKEGYTTNYSMKSSTELPMFSKIIILVSGIIILLLLLFACININSVINQSFKSRYHEIGLMKALGFAKRNILNILIYEVFFIAISSFFISVILSKGITLAINNFMLAKNLTIASMKFNYLQILASFIIILFIMFISSLKSILKASRLNPIENLRKE